MCTASHHVWAIKMCFASVCGNLGGVGVYMPAGVPQTLVMCTASHKEHVSSAVLCYLVSYGCHWNLWLCYNIALGMSAACFLYIIS